MSKNKVVDESSEEDEDEEESVEPNKDIDGDDSDDTDEVVTLPQPKVTPKAETGSSDDEESEVENVVEANVEQEEDSDETISIDKVFPEKVGEHHSSSIGEEDDDSDSTTREAVVRPLPSESEDEETTVLVEDPIIEESSSDSSDSLSQNSIAEMLENQIKLWYTETDLRRPKKRERIQFESILQEDVDLSDLMLSDQEMEMLNAEIAEMRDLTLDELLYKINSDL